MRPSDFSLIRSAHIRIDMADADSRSPDSRASLKLCYSSLARALNEQPSATVVESTIACEAFSNCFTDSFMFYLRDCCSLCLSRWGYKNAGFNVRPLTRERQETNLLCNR